MTRDEEYQKLKDNSPWALPFNPSEEGWTAAQIKEKFWKGLIVLLDIINSDRDALTTKLSSIDALLDDLNSVSKVMPRAIADEDGVSIKSGYAKAQSLTNGLISVLKYIKENGQTGNIYDLETAINTVRTNLEALISEKFSGEKAKKAIDADYSDRAYKDSDGNVIKNTYVKQGTIDSLSSLITAIANGTSVVDKARKDQDGNRIDQTYIKIANIVDSLTSTSTTQPLSANQGKVLDAKIDAILALLQSNDTDLDTIQEIVTYIKSNKSLIDGITTSKVSVSDIIDNLTSETISKPLSANQGVVIKALIDALAASKADAESVYTKQGAKDMVDEKIAGISSVNVITDQDNVKVFDWRLVVRGERVYLAVTDITETE
jgi:hypothetical protein